MNIGSKNLPKMGLKSLIKYLIISMNICPKNNKNWVKIAQDIIFFKINGHWSKKLLKWA